jgi:hypothetical protein
MDEKVYYWASVLFAALALALLVTNISLISGNRTLQTDIARRQAIITNGTNLVQVHQGLVQALAEVAVHKNDKDVRDLLAEQGITVKDNAAPTKGDDGADGDATSDKPSKKK